MINSIKNWFLFWITFLITILFWIIWYWAWSNLSIVNSWDSLTASKWNELINKVNIIWNTYAPSWAVMSFYLTNCPEWWRPADWTNLTPDLRGQFIRWLNTFNAWLTTRTDWRQDPVNRSLWDYQDDAFQWHNRRISINNWYSPWTKAKPTLDVSINSDNNNNANTTILQTTNGDYFIDGIYWTPRVANETRSKNVALIYCVKN